MKTFTRTQLPDSLVYNGKTYTFFSALDREGAEAESKGIPVVRVRIDNEKRRASRRMFKWTGRALMTYHNPTDYYYAVKK